MGTRYSALQDQFLELRGMHEARGEATAAQNMHEAATYRRLSSELESATLTELQLERACHREAQNCRFEEDSLNRYESFMRRKLYDLAESEVELRNTEQSWMQMRAETDNMFRQEAQMQSAFATEHTKYLEAEALVSRLRQSEAAAASTVSQ